MDRIQTFRDKTLSLWQSAAEEVELKHEKQGLVGMMADGRRGSERPDLSNKMIAAATIAAEAHQTGSTVTEVANRSSTLAALPESTVQLAEQCVDLALQLGLARITGDQQRIHVLQQELKFNVCDVRWSETVEEFVRNFELARATIPYRSFSSLTDFVVEEASDKMRVAIVGDRI